MTSAGEGRRGIHATLLASGGVAFAVAFLLAFYARGCDGESCTVKGLYATVLGLPAYAAGVLCVTAGLWRTAATFEDRLSMLVVLGGASVAGLWLLVRVAG